MHAWRCAATRAQRNLLERLETELLGGTLDTAGDEGGIQPDPILQGLVDVIGQGKSDIDAYATIVEGLTKYFQSVADVMSKLQDYISAKDDKNMKIDGGKIKALIQQVIDHLPTMQLPKGPTSRAGARSSAMPSRSAIRAS